MKINTLFKRTFLFVMLAASANGAFAGSSPTYYSKCDASVATGSGNCICIHQITRLPQNQLPMDQLQLINKIQLYSVTSILLRILIIFMPKQEQVTFFLNGQMVVQQIHIEFRITTSSKDANAVLSLKILLQHSRIKPEVTVMSENTTFGGASIKPFV
jgi:hypothetical protein